MLLTAYLLIYHVAQQLRSRLSKSGDRKSQNMLLEIATTIITQRSTNDAIRSSLDFLRNQFHVERAAALLSEPKNESFLVKCCHGMGAEELKYFDMGKSLIRWLVKHRRPFILTEAEQSMAPSAYYQMTYALREAKIELCHPLFFKDTLGGVLLLGHKANRTAYGSKDFEILSLLGTVLASVIENNKLSDQVLVDSLTGLFHQKYFKNRLAEELLISHRNRSALALIMLDIDHFKRLNDTQGHQAGDKVLETVAKTLQESVRASDILARYGGEEFAIYIREGSRPSPQADKGQAVKHDFLAAVERVAEKMRLSVQQQKVLYRDRLFEMTVSVGVGFKSEKEKDVSVQELIQRADQALYDAKQKGRNRVSVATRDGIRAAMADPSHHDTFDTEDRPLGTPGVKF
jgi:diguanylate cyclase (GGDEF)-like protein